MCSISFQVGTFKRPDPDTISDRDLEVDIIKAWTDLDKSLIAEGLIQGLSLSVRVLYAIKRSIKDYNIPVHTVS